MPSDESVYTQADGKLCFCFKVKPVPHFEVLTEQKPYLPQCMSTLSVFIQKRTRGPQEENDEL